MLSEKCFYFQENPCKIAKKSYCLEIPGTLFGKNDAHFGINALVELSL